MLSQKGRYALKALTYMAHKYGSGPSQVSAIAESETIPRKFLETIMSDLRRVSLVTSVRGKSGGYMLARPPEQIMFGDVIRATDGPLAMLPCVSKNFYRRCEDCVSEDLCAIRKVMALVRDEMSTILDNTSLCQAIEMFEADSPAEMPANC